MSAAGDLCHPRVCSTSELGHSRERQQTCTEGGGGEEGRRGGGEEGGGEEGGRGGGEEELVRRGKTRQLKYLVAFQTVPIIG